FMRDFLLLARPASDIRETIDIRGIFEDVLESIHYAPDWYEGIEVVRKLSDQYPPILGNKIQIRQLIWNLVLNAVQSMSDGGVLTVEVGKALLAGREHLEIRITDSGCGLGEEDREKIFEPFYTTKERGTGLGLAIVNRIIGNYAGKIRIESNPGRGTTFIVCLPRTH
ncbi:MAG: ATP-binding protein, partial [Syntrophales bacterium]|nr:ATP-binding protein [Syntrophales bacterium]